MKETEMEEFDDENIIVLNDENDNEIRFEYLDCIEYQGEQYMVLFPCDGPVDGKKIVILKVEDTGDTDEETYGSVDDENIYNAVLEIFTERFKEEFFKEEFFDD